MENHYVDAQEKNAVAHTQKEEIGLPLVALGLDVLPIFLVYLGLPLPSFVYLFILLSPIAGLITGIVALSRGKARIGLMGKVISIIAIVLPLFLIILIIIVFIGAMTGTISFM